ncbi:MAG TPA: GatB/YqeY domain-containing protein [Verrucomicrobiae bacterium]|nr:GatB/YqeY domain-containing protein [Verrucomicrobiae bacterium]
MSLQDRISRELKEDMLAKDAEKLSTLRLLKSALGYLQIEKKTDQLSDAEITSVIQKESKKRRDSIEQYRSGGRPELADKEARELAVLDTFLPPPLSPDELEKLVRAAIQELAATTKKEMGPVVKAVQAKAAGRADGKAISSVVGKLLP